MVNDAFFSETLGKNLYISMEIKCKRPGDLGKFFLSLKKLYFCHKSMDFSCFFMEISLETPKNGTADIFVDFFNFYMCNR